MSIFHSSPQQWLINGPQVRAWSLGLKFGVEHRAQAARQRKAKAEPRPDDDLYDNVVRPIFRDSAARAGEEKAQRAPIAPEAKPQQARDPLRRRAWVPWPTRRPDVAEPEAEPVSRPEGVVTGREVVIWRPPHARQTPAVFALPRGAVWAAVGLLAVPATAFATAYVTAVVRHDEVVARHERLIEAASAVQVRDQSERLVAALPRQAGGDGRTILRAEEVPEPFSEMLTNLEDKYARGFNVRHVFGVDVGALIATPVCRMAQPILKPVWSFRCGGTSSLLMQGVRGGYAWIGGRGQGAELRHRKATEVFDTMSLSLDGGPTQGRMAAFVADRLVYGFGHGQTIWGVEGAALHLWGVHAGDLTIPQQAVLAAAPNVQYRTVCEDASPAELRDATDRWNRVKARADKALRLTYASGPNLEAHRRAVAAMPLPHPHPLDPDLTAGLSAVQACQAAGNLVARGGLVASSAMIAARPEIAGAIKADPTLKEVQLAVDVGANRELRADVEAALIRANAAQRGRLHMPLTGNPAQQADVLLAVANPQGQIEQLYASNGRPMLDAPRKAGSLSKLAVALAAVDAGFSASEPLCNRRDDQTGVHNADGSSGYATCTGDALVSWSAAFGRSMNLPVLDLARQVPDQRLRRAADVFGLELPRDVVLTNAMVLGEAKISPRRALANAQAIAEGLAGRPAIAYAPRVIARVRVNGQWVEQPPQILVDLRSYFTNPRAVEVMRAAAGSAVRVPKGTLAGAVTPQAPVWPEEIGKSGTVAGPAPQNFTIAKLAMGAGLGPQRRAWVGVMAAPENDLGDHISALELWRVGRSAASGVAPPAAGVSTVFDVD